MVAKTNVINRLPNAEHQVAVYKSNKMKATFQTNQVHKKSHTENKEIYTNLLEESCLVPGDKEPLLLAEEITWLDKTQVQIALDWLKEYFGLYISITLAAIVTSLVAVKPASTIVYCADVPFDSNNFMCRFVGKLRGSILMLYEMLDRDTQKVFYKIRKIHSLAVTRLDKMAEGKTLPELLAVEEEQWMLDLVHAVQKDVATIPNKPGSISVSPQIKENLSWNAKLPFSQFGMVYFAVTFFGSVWQQPQMFGMKDRNDPKMKAWAHMWALISKLLGLQDEFNILIDPQPEVIDGICRDVFIQSLAEIDTVVVYLQNKVSSSLAEYIPVITHKQALCYTLQAFGCKSTDNVWKQMSYKDKFLFKFVKGMLWMAANITWFRHFTNWLAQKFINRLYKVVLNKPGYTF